MLPAITPNTPVKTVTTFGASTGAGINLKSNHEIMVEIKITAAVLAIATINVRV
jgi:hypothetical protein